MEENKVGYIRVSSFDQNTDRQLDGLKLDRVFIDKASGKDINRPELEKLLAYVRAGIRLLCIAWIDWPAIWII